jgi:hypothetical protein
MSGGGKIIEKLRMTLASGKKVVRYHVMTEYRPDWFDETCVYAEPSAKEPQLGESIVWGADKLIHFGTADSLTKVGYSFRPPLGAKP